jgi:hypothetical protein
MTFLVLGIDPDWSAADLTAAIARAKGERQSPALRSRFAKALGVRDQTRAA